MLVLEEEETYPREALGQRNSPHQFQEVGALYCKVGPSSESRTSLTLRCFTQYSPAQAERQTSLAEEELEEELGEVANCPSAGARGSRRVGRQNNRRGTELWRTHSYRA